ncbi:LysR family transcriptional regulator [Bosea sp. SSUT16]|uniref:LysR family transcriptional regulator n=1 Tax=Bosea spartocytisi TaxID=2773451 RepID=A0A927I3C9_9HYPH|nr:LysR family transcriptional regulator [Bosea spartocytisi]MBD3848878.1 LysR family transcriptional regulator [Bosea spartocytisi]
MDIAAAKTFLEIVSTGSFVNAASNLHITQTAVGARMRVLEEELGQQLFTRTKAGVTLTPAGERFMRFAMGFVQMWERARRTVSVPDAQIARITLGAELIVSNPLIQNWLQWMRNAHPEFALAAYIDNPDSLVERVQAGTLDLAVLYGMARHPNLVTELLVEEKLVLVETTGHERTMGMEDYVAIDWGRDFTAAYQAAFPDRTSPSVTVNYGPVALAYLLAVGGTAYLRMMVARPLLESGRVRLVGDAPQFPYSIHAVYSSAADEEMVRVIRQGLRTSMGWSSISREA